MIKVVLDTNMFIECAVALKADCIVSGDKGLLAVRDYMGLEIITPKTFLKIFMKRQH